MSRDPGQTSGEAGQSAAVQAARDAYEAHRFRDACTECDNLIDALCAAVAREAIAQLPCYWCWMYEDITEKERARPCERCPSCKARAT